MRRLEGRDHAAQRGHPGGRGHAARSAFAGAFLGKLVLEVLPAALASVIGGFLFTQYQFGHPDAPRPVAEQAAPASAETMQIVREEHAMILDFLKAQRAAEKRRLAAAEEEDASAAADAKTAVAVAAAATRRTAAASVASKPAAPRNKATGVAAAAAARRRRRRPHRRRRS